MMACVRFIVMTFLFFGNQHAVCQTAESQLLPVPLEKTKSVVIPPAEHPYASLAVLVSSRKAPHNFAGVEPGSGFLSYLLSKDGSILSRGLVPRPRRKSPERLVNRIKFYGNSRGHCVLDLWIEDGDVDLSSVVKAIEIA